MGNVLHAEPLAPPRWHEAHSPVTPEAATLGACVRGADLARGRPLLSRREVVLLGLLVLSLHLAALYGVARRPVPLLPEVPVQVPPMSIEFTRPAPPVVEPPPPAPEPVIEPPPPPVVDELASKPPAKPQPAPKPRPQPPKPQAKAPPPAPPQPAPPPVAEPLAEAPPPAPVETPPSANAGYLNNPAPEYPALAHRRGWEGTVQLRVEVLASGLPRAIEVQRSSGRSALDEAAIRAVKRWRFVPAKRGDQAVAGWVTVPLEFRLN